jgi:hypothetical protein
VLISIARGEDDMLLVGESPLLRACGQILCSGSFLPQKTAMHSGCISLAQAFPGQCEDYGVCCR